MKIFTLLFLFLSSFSHATLTSNQALPTPFQDVEAVDHLFSQIIGALPPEDLTSAMTVSTKWNRLANNQQVWKASVLKHSSYSTKGLLKAYGKYGNIAMARKLIQEDNADPQDLQLLLMNSIEEKKWKKMNQLLSLGVDLNKIELNCLNGISTVKCTPLVWAIKNQELDTLHELLKAGADVNQKSIKGKDALFYAVSWNAQAVQMLLKGGAQLRKKDGSFRNSLLFSSVSVDQVEMTRTLIESGADIHAVRKTDGMTSLHIAASKGNKQLANLLLDLGADLTAKDFDEQTPCDVLEEEGENYLELKKILCSKEPSKQAIQYSKQTKQKCSVQ